MDCLHLEPKKVNKGEEDDNNDEENDSEGEGDDSEKEQNEEFWGVAHDVARVRPIVNSILSASSGLFLFFVTTNRGFFWTGVGVFLLDEPLHTSRKFLTSETAMDEMMSELVQDKPNGAWGLPVDHQAITMMNKLLFVLFKLARVHLTMGTVLFFR